MTVPSTYFEWVDRLEQFAKGDDSLLADLEQGSFTVDAGTVYGFYKRVQEAYVERKKRWIDKFNRLFQVQYIKTENDLSILLQDAKVNLQPIAKFIRLKAFPDDLRDTLRKDFEDFVSEVWMNIRESVRKTQPRNEKMLMIVNTFSFLETVLEIREPGKFSSDLSSTEIPNKRRIIF